MSELNLSLATTTNFSSAVPDFIVKSKALDFATKNQEETYLYFDEAPKMFWLYLTIPHIFNAANALITWAFNRGYKVIDPNLKAQLDHVRGVGNESTTKILSKHGLMKIVVGDSFTEFKRNDKGIILNMISHSPERVRVVFTQEGLIKRYDVWNGKEWKAVKKENMLHSSNKKLGDSLGGTSQISPSQFIINALQEALQDERTIKHRDKALGIVYYQTDKSGKIAYANTQIENAVKNGEMVGLPQDTAKIEPWPSKSSEDRTGWIQLLENQFYQNFGVPRSIASSDGTSEVGGKMGHVIFEPVYTREQTELEDDLEIQQAVILKFNRPPTLGGMQPELDERKNTGQTSFQPNDVSATTERE